MFVSQLIMFSLEMPETMSGPVLHHQVWRDRRQSVTVYASCLMPEIMLAAIVCMMHVQLQLSSAVPLCTSVSTLHLVSLFWYQ